MEYKVLKIKLQKRHWLSTFFTSPLGIALVATFFTGYLSTYIFLNNKLQNIDEEYKKNFSELRIDSIKSGATNVTFDKNKNTILFFGLTYWIKIKNYSKDVCNLIGVTTTDTSIIYPFIREKILKRDTNFRVSLDLGWTGRVLYPNESNWFKVQTYFNSNDSLHYLHNLFLYTNVYGGIYDLYVIKKINYFHNDNEPLKQIIDSIKRSINVIIPKMIYFSDTMKVFAPYIYSYEDIYFLNHLKIKDTINN